MGRRDGPTHLCCDKQPQGRAKECRHHDEGEVEWLNGEGIEIDDSASHSLSDIATSDHGAAHFEDRGDHECLLHAERSRAHRRAERVGDVVTADVERHEQAHDDGRDEDAPRSNVGVAKRPVNAQNERAECEDTEGEVPIAIGAKELALWFEDVVRHEEQSFEGGEWTAS